MCMKNKTVMALAALYPELIRERVVGTAFVGTSSGRLGEVNFGLPVAGVNAVRRVLQADDLVLVKASRGTKLERVSDLLAPPPKDGH